MNFEFLVMIGQLVLALSVTLGLMFLSFKVIGPKFNSINNNKYVRIIERVQVTKENSILIVKIGEKGYIMTSTSERMDKLTELSEDEIHDIEENKKKANEDIIKNYNELILKSKKIFSKGLKNIKSKEEKNEK